MIDAIRLAIGQEYASLVALVEEHQDDLPFDFLAEAQGRLCNLRDAIAAGYCAYVPNTNGFNNLADAIGDLPDPEEVLDA